MKTTKILQIVLGFVLTVFAREAAAQVGQQSTDDGGPLPSLEGGDPASSYALSGLEHINHFNGNFNIVIPLLKVGGRGKAGYTIVLPIQQRWSVTHNSGFGYESYVPSGTARDPSQFGYYSDPFVYSPGTLRIVNASAQPYACLDNNYNWYDLGPYVTRLVWSAPDGTETTLLDTAYNGQPQGTFPNNGTACGLAYGYQPVSRGRNFRSSDGSGMHFVADQDIQDANGISGGAGGTTGTLYFRDGTHYHINQYGWVDWIEDTNGNRSQLSYGQDPNTYFWNSITITDPLGRTTTVSTSPSQDTITYPGRNTTHTITIHRTNLQYALSSGYARQTLHDLFSELDGSEEPYDPVVTQSVDLPDGTQYQFGYNSYAEPAELRLPTTGLYRYSYGSGTGSGSGVIQVGPYSGYSIYRRVVERDEFADGTNPSAKTIFPLPSYANYDSNHAGRVASRVEVDFEDPGGNILRKEAHFFYGNPSASDSVPALPTDSPKWTDGMEFRTEIGDAGATLQTTQQVYAQRPCGALDPNCWFDPQTDAAGLHDPQVCQSNTTLDNGAVATVTFAYDQYNNPTDKWEYDYDAPVGIGPSCPGAPVGFTRHTQTYYVENPYTDMNILSLAEMVILRDKDDIPKQKTHFGYDEYGQGANLVDADIGAGHNAAYSTGWITRGNLTNPATCLDPGTGKYDCGRWINHVRDYDIAGNLVRAYDGNLHTTEYGYNDDGARLFAFPTSIKNALGQITSPRYYYDAGKIAWVTDVNGVTTKYSYVSSVNGDPSNGTVDGLDRVRQVIRGDQTPLENQTNIQYLGPNFTITLQDQNAEQDYGLQTQKLYDGLGRVIENRTMVDNAHLIVIEVDTTYDALGRVRTVTNPSSVDYSSGGGVRDGLGYATTYLYDALGRVKQVQTADSASVTTDYSGPFATVTDQAGKRKKYQYDALGRLFNVREDPDGSDWTTDYRYDVMDHLTSVTQGYCPTCQARTFTYNSLGQLTQAVNPESGVTNYTLYDDAGNLRVKTDAGGVTTTYGYDEVNRLISKTYNDGTRPVTYRYDNPNVFYSKGRLTQVDNQVSAVNYTEYDPLGRVKQSNQQVAGVSATYSFQYNYNLAGALTSETYPSGRTISTIYDAVDRAYSVAGNWSGQNKSYVTGSAYWPHGALWFPVYGNNVVPAVAYNSRLQPQAVYGTILNDPSRYLWQMNYTWGASAIANNGNLTGIDEGYGTEVPYGSLRWYSQTFHYDPVNRLLDASETSANCGGTCWYRNFGYDQWGNQWVSANGGLTMAGDTPQSNVYEWQTNRRPDRNPDAVGNQQWANGDTLAYDAENRVRTVAEPQWQGGLTLTYTYDGDGRRVMKSGDGYPTTLFIYDAFGQLAAKYVDQAAPAVACQTCYLAYDHLGSVRVVTDESGHVVARHDYLPFGEEILPPDGGRGTAQSGISTFGTADGVYQRFTGQIRDSETGLDFFEARYLSGAFGRFTSADPLVIAAADLANPQSLNLYSYVWNSPLINTDPTGTDICPDGSYADACVTAPAPPPTLFDLFPFLPGYPSDIGQATSQSSPQVPTFSTTVTLFAGNRAKNGTAKPTLSQCMAANAGNFSLVGGVDKIFGTSFGNTFVGGLLGGNSITGFFYGSLNDNAQTAISNTSGILTRSMGVATTYGRRTSTIMSLNLAGKGGLPRVLGTSSGAARGAIGTAGKVLGLGLSFEERLAVDATATALEVAYCVAVTQ